MPKIEQLRLTPRATPGATPRATPKMMHYDACPTQTAARYMDEVEDKRFASAIATIYRYQH